MRTPTLGRSSGNDRTSAEDGRGFSVVVVMASRYGVPIVEDDPYGLLYYDEALPSLKTLDDSGRFIDIDGTTIPW